jgi:hypothetical protein
MEGGKKGRKDYFEVPYAALRCLVEPAFSERSVMTHSSYLKKAKVVISTAKIASSTQIITDDGEIVPYDFLVICTGSSYTGPKTRPERIQEYWKGGWTYNRMHSLSLSLSLCLVALPYPTLQATFCSKFGSTYWSC